MLAPDPACWRFNLVTDWVMLILFILKLYYAVKFQKALIFPHFSKLGDDMRIEEFGEEKWKVKVKTE